MGTKEERPSALRRPASKSAPPANPLTGSPSAEPAPAKQARIDLDPPSPPGFPKHLSEKSASQGSSGDGLGSGAAASSAQNRTSEASFGDLLAELQRMRHSIDNMRSEFGASIGGLREEVGDVKGEVSKLKADVSDLKSEVEVAKSDCISKPTFEELSVRVGKLELQGGSAGPQVRPESERKIRVQLDAQDPARKKIACKGFQEDDAKKRIFDLKSSLNLLAYF